MRVRGANKGKSLFLDPLIPAFSLREKEPDGFCDTLSREREFVDAEY